MSFISDEDRKALNWAKKHMPKDGKATNTQEDVPLINESEILQRIKKLEAKSKNAPDMGEIKRIDEELDGMEKMFDSTEKAIETLEVNAKKARESLAKSIKINTENIVRTMEIMDTQNKLKL